VKPAGIFVTGTDTGIGKTVVSAVLVSILRADGTDAVPMKPVQTGCEIRDGRMTAPDLEFAVRPIDPALSPDEMDMMCPYRFEAPCSPHLAAAREERAVSVECILGCFHDLAERHDFVVVEGAGGVLVPLNEQEMMVDLMAGLHLPVLLVARPGLGTLNHTLLSLRELSRAGLDVLGVVFNETSAAGPGYIESDNAATIERLGGVPVLGRLPRVEDVHRFPDAIAELAAHLPPASRIMERMAEVTS